jgi:hypothetical protein
LSISLLQVFLFFHSWCKTKISSSVFGGLNGRSLSLGSPQSAWPFTVAHGVVAYCCPVQIENEYVPEEKEFGAAGKLYSNWVANMAVGDVQAG